MSGPIDDPIPYHGPTGAADADVVALKADLASDGGTRLGRYTARARTVAKGLAVLVVGTGVVALLVAIGAYRNHPAVLVFAVICCLPAVIAPLYLARRVGALATAAAQPKELAHQVQDLVYHVRDSPELRDLAARVARRRGRPVAGPVSEEPRGRIRGAISLARLASTVVGQAQPDEARHRLLVPFTPERLTSTWSAVGVSLWGWVVAAIVLAVSLPVLLVSAL